MPSKILTLLLSLAAQSGVYARPTGPRAIAEISTALVLLNDLRRAVKGSADQDTWSPAFPMVPSSEARNNISARIDFLDFPSCFA